MDPAPQLPDDVLAGVLRRLAPRCLAASRCVCRASSPAPPSAAAAVSGRLDYTVPGEPDRMPALYVHDHCNGLLLLDDCVVNPATRRWALLPPRPDDLPQPVHPGMDVSTDEYLVFDPTLSPGDFELFIVPSVPYKLSTVDECEASEWPPSTLILSVFSSKTCSWEERAFGREGEAAGTQHIQHSDEDTDADDNGAIVEEKVEENYEWDSDNDNVLEPGSRSKDSCIDFLGFHPYKEVVFLTEKFDRVLAYNWSSSKIQDLGKVFPKFYYDYDLQFFHRYVKASFLYTPCLLGELPEKQNLEAQQLED
nr:unnamed protein product [Digitaria exilis]